MDSSWDRGRRGPRPGAASVRVTDLSWHGLQNPRPLIKDDAAPEVLMEEYLSPSKLQALAQVDDLRQVTVLEMCVDTRENSLGNFGTYLPNLSQLKLNNSLLSSIRDLGTSLSHLQILWMVRCGLADLDGICSLRSLKELYISYNNISDLSQICLLDQLEVLDLEGNNIESIGQVRYLGLCKKLSRLTLEGNMICLRPDPEAAEAPDYNYRAEVRKLIPHLQFLDEVPASQTSLQGTRKLNKDWLIVKESIKEGNIVDDASRFGSPLADALIPEELVPDSNDSSDLTHGVSRVLCGNPIKGLQERRQKLHPPSSQDHSGIPAQPSPPGSVRSSTQAQEEPSVGEEEGLDWPGNLWAELKTWREQQQQRRLNRLLVGRSTQISHKEEDKSTMLNDREEEEKSKAKTKLKGTLGACPGSPGPGPDPSKVRSNTGWPMAGSNYPLIPSSFKHPSPPPLPSPSGRSRSELRGRRLSLSLNLTASPFSSLESGAHSGEKLTVPTPFRCLTTLRSSGTQNLPEHRGLGPAMGAGSTEPK